MENKKQLKAQLTMKSLRDIKIELKSLRIVEMLSELK